MKTILQIGNEKRRSFRRKNRKGFSFFEVMVTTVILSAGLVLIYKAFFISLDYLGHFKHRLYAIALMDNKVYELQRMYEEKRAIPFSKKSEMETVQINNREVDFFYDLAFRPMTGLEKMCRADVTLSWTENGRDISLARTVYVSDLNLEGFKETE